MPRRKPTSGKQKKEQQQIKRAIKRGDLPPTEPTKKVSHKRRQTRVGSGKVVGHGSSDVAIASARKLQSTFIKLPSTFLEKTKAVASTVPLSRPIGYDAAVLDLSVDRTSVNRQPLTCPKRPKWRFDMSKKEVQHNEEGIFKKWLEQTDLSLTEWNASREPDLLQPNAEASIAPPPSPSYFERNIEVWRQLWRVTEISQIILVLLDSRCPLLHFPSSLAAYLANHKVIFVLTKIDITGPARVAAWMEYLLTHHPHIPVVPVEAYTEKEATTVRQGRKHYEPHLPETFRRRLIDVVKAVHSEMIKPPANVAQNPDWLEKWVPPVKRDIDWSDALNVAGSASVAIDDTASAKMKSTEDEKDGEGLKPDFLTIGLIGQPNVGKSSLLNALFGTKIVRASKTPGKTKHFQTLFLTQDIRLVDCPGLVVPNYVPMEMQVLSSILPISRVAAIPACINYINKLLPLERIFRLNLSSLSGETQEDKRTWREGMQPSKQKSVQWTSMDILIAYANVKGWVTAKAGRPDIHRAGNAILRAVAEGRISWGFWPPGTPLDIISQQSTEPDAGIWIPGRDEDDESNDVESDEKDEVEEDEPITSSDDESEESDEASVTLVNAGRFNALRIDDPESGGESDR
ncbi:hypothetical protein Agabi119p4_269 [Agaricus bisporus var. burnettii]|uniref:Guanine nucleotide-binding protein-like 1 n=1 Tax=Agaricus bisporus var. burnettii TaxID=192524 RepID=A0A8H7KKZ1_AGABI|nr:hypothetical protein Agabi119p4_269 [Agaricus bisporus var. burnettii]